MPWLRNLVDVSYVLGNFRSLEELQKRCVVSSSVQLLDNVSI